MRFKKENNNKNYVLIFTSIVSSLIVDFHPSANHTYKLCKPI